MDGLDVPPGADGQPLVPAELWATFPPAAQAIMVALAQRVVALEAEVRDLKARLGRNSSNSSRPPSSDPPHVKRRPVAPPRGRRAGGQPGHPGAFRALGPPERVDTVVDPWPSTCVGCATPLTPPPRHSPAALATRAATTDDVPHQVTELPPVRAVVTEHRLHRVVCPACGVTTRAVLPADVPAGAFGPRLQATVATLSGRFCLSRREVAELCDTMLEAPLSVGSVAMLCQGTSAALATPVAKRSRRCPRRQWSTPTRRPGRRGKRVPGCGSPSRRW